ncbi:unnamed protein product, partial [Closterium sp. NIES-53]
MTSLSSSSGSGDGGGGSSGSGGGCSNSRCGAVRWGVSGGGQMQLHRRPRETLPPQQLREWYASRSGGGVSSGTRTAAVQLGVSSGGLVQLQQRPRETLTPQQLREWYDQRGASRSSARCPYVIRTGASRCFFRDSTTLTPLSAPVPVRLADPTGDLVLARSSTVLPCPAVPSNSLSSLHLPSFSTNLVSTAALQDAMVTTTTPGGQCVSICTCTQTGRHLASFTHRPGSSLYTLATEPPQVGASAQVSASGLVASPCSCRLLSHQTLLWHHRLGNPSLPRLRGMHSRLLVSGLPRSLPPDPPLPAPPCLPCVEGQQRAAPHSSFPPTTAPLHTLHMDVWGPPRVSGQGHGRNFLLVVDDNTRYTMVFPLYRKGEVPDFLIPCIRALHLQLRERFRQDLPVLRLHSDRGGEFSSNLLRDFCRGEGILQSFTLSDSPQQNGITERRIGLVIKLNLWPRVSLLKTSPTLRWTGEVGDASVFRVWGSRAFVRDMFANKLSTGAIPCVFLGFSVPFYCLFPYRSAPLPPPPLFLDPSPPPVDPLPLQGHAPSGVSQVDPLPGTVPVEVGVDPGAARGAASGGAASGDAEPARVEPGGAEPEGAESEGAGSGGAEPGGAEPGGSEPAGAEPRGAKPEGAELKGAESEGAESGGAEPRAAGAGDSTAGGTRAEGVGATRLGGAGVTTRAGGTGGTGAAGTGGVGGAGAIGAGAGDPGAGGAGTGGTRFGGARAGGTGTGGAGAGAGDTGAVDPGARGAGTGGAVSRGTDARGTVQRCPFFIMPQPSSLPPPDSVLRQPDSPMPAPFAYAAQTYSFTEHREPESRPALLVRAIRTGRWVPRPRPPPLPGTHVMALRPSSVPLRVPLPPPPESYLPAVPDPESDLARASSPTVSRLLAIVVTDPSFESTAASALIVELVKFAAACRLDHATALVAESESNCPPSVGGECALGTNVLEDRQEEFECLAAAVPHLVVMLLAPEGDPDALDIPPPCSYAEAITGPYSSQWQTAMDTEMASWKSTGTYVDAVLRGEHSRWHVDLQAQRDYELHSLDFSTAFLQGSLHEGIWLRRPLGFTGSFPAGTQWSLQWPVYGLRQAPRKWHDTLRTTLAALGFAPLTADPSLFLRTDTSLPPFYVLVILAHYVAPGRHRLEHWEAAKRVLRYLCGTSGMGLVLGGRGPVVLTGHTDASWVDNLAMQRSSQGYTWRSTRSSLVLSSSCEAEIYAGAMAAQELRWLTYLLTDLGEQPRSPLVLYVDNKAMIALCQEHRLEHRTKHITLRYFLARELQQRGQLRLAYVATRANTSDIFTKALQSARAEPRRPNRAAPPWPSRATLLCPTCINSCSCSYCITATVPTAATATMATPSVLTFDAEGRPIKFEVWLDDLHLFLQITAKDDVSLYDHTSGAAPAPPTTADSTARSQWQTRDAHARLAI